MKRKTGWMQTTIIAVFTAMVCSAWAEPAAGEPAAKPEGDKAAVQKQREQEEAKKGLETVKKQIADCEKEIQGIQDRQAAGKEQDMYQEKRLEVVSKQLDLLKYVQTALEANDVNQARVLREQIQTLMSEWWTYGERAARIDAQRAAWTIRLGAEQNPEIKTAWEQLIQSFDAVLKKAAEKKALESELKNLELKQRESASKLERLYRDSQMQKDQPKAEAEKAKPKPADKAE